MPGTFGLNVLSTGATGLTATRLAQLSVFALFRNLSTRPGAKPKQNAIITPRGPGRIIPGQVLKHSDHLSFLTQQRHGPLQFALCHCYFACVKIIPIIIMSL